MLREKTSVKSTRMNTKVLNSGGVTRSSAEVPVMGVERRGRVTQILPMVNCRDVYRRSH